MSNSIDSILVEELYKKYGNWKDTTIEYNIKTSENRSQGSLRKNYSRFRNRNEETREETHTSERYIEVSTSEFVTAEELLELHGYDPQEFELVTSNSTRSKIGTKGNEEQYFINTYSKITVKKKVFTITEELIEKLINKSKVKEIIIDSKISNPNGLIEIPLFDMHFGNNTYEDYKPHQNQIYNYINSKSWDQTLFVIGQDLFHNDNFRGTTTSGTPIAHEDMEKAWEDALSFYKPLIEIALEKSYNVNIIYSRGNHDETLAWSFVKMLDRIYPEIEVCSKQSEHKHFIYKNIFLGYTHGDKIKDSKVVRNFEALFRREMALSNRRIIKKGHIHTMKSFDDNGTHVMTLGTANKTDRWHLDNGFIGNHQAFEIFIYNDNTLKAHLFID